MYACIESFSKFQLHSYTPKLNSEYMLKRKESEKALEKTLRVKVKAIGGHALKFSSSIEAGYPDRIVLLPCGAAVFVELKSEGEKPRKLQTLRHEELKQLGFRVAVIDSTENLNQFIEECKTIIDYELCKKKL